MLLELEPPHVVHMWVEPAAAALLALELELPPAKITSSASDQAKKKTSLSNSIYVKNDP